MPLAQDKWIQEWLGIILLFSSKQLHQYLHIAITYSFLLTSGFVGKPFPHVTLLDISDGKAGIVRVARQLCEKAQAKEMKSCEVNLEFIHEFIIKDAGVPEADLAIYCGDICSTYGFLPWHSRVTEFL